MHGYPPVDDAIVRNAREALLRLAISFEYQALRLVKERERLRAELAELRSFGEDCKPVNILINTARANYMSYPLTCEVMNRFYEVVTKRAGVLSADTRQLIELSEKKLTQLEPLIAERFAEATTMLALEEMAEGISRNVDQEYQFQSRKSG